MTASTHVCKRCGGDASRRLQARDLNWLGDDARFDYWRCHSCAVVWLPEVPANLGDYYPRDYYEQFPDDDEMEAAALEEQRRLGLVNSGAASGQLVEIGPGVGEFALAAKRAGFDVIGLEMDAEACKHLEGRGIKAIVTEEPAVELAKLAPSEAIVMWHLIEHLDDPWTLLRACAANLVAGGSLALATPNPGSLQFGLQRSRWVHLDAPRHLTLIPLDALVDELRGLGLELETVLTNDQPGRECNHLGWSQWLTRAPRLRELAGTWAIPASVISRILRPIEETGLRGTTYSAVFRKTQS